MSDRQYTFNRITIYVWPTLNSHWKINISTTRGCQSDIKLDILDIYLCPGIFQYHKDHNSWTIKVTIINIDLHFVTSNNISKFEKLWLVKAQTWLERSFFNLSRTVTPERWKWKSSILTLTSIFIIRNNISKIQKLWMNCSRVNAPTLFGNGLPRCLSVISQHHQLRLQLSPQGLWPVLSLCLADGAGRMSRYRRGNDTQLVKIAHYP